jgi:TolA-binding protein
MSSLPSVLLRSLIACVVCAAGLATRAAEPPALSPDAAEPRVTEFLARPREPGDAFAAHLAVKGWLARHPAPSTAVLVAAGDAALAAGDLQAAAGLYKRFIAAAPADEARSVVAARLYDILIGKLGSTDDAYTFFVRDGLALRQSLPARQFDLWFLEQARARRDAVTAARILAAVMADGLPLELERWLYWDHLDWAMGELARATPDRIAAAPSARQIVGLLRESPTRAARYGFIAACLEFQAAAGGMDAAARAAAFGPVAAAATAYVDAVPTATALNDALTVFWGTGNQAAWEPVGGLVRAWWVASFSKLPDGEKAAAINPQGMAQLQASPEQWVELGTQFAPIFRQARGTPGLPTLLAKPDPAVFAAQATYLAGVPSESARLINAIAATKGTDLLAGLEHLWQAESWHGEFNATWATAGQVVNMYRSFPRQPPVNEGELQRAVTTWGQKAVARTPLALFDPAAAAGWLATAFAAADPADKQPFAAELRRLDWVPWDKAARRAAIKPAHDRFRQWADQVRGQPAAGQVAALEQEFAKAFDAEVTTKVDWAALADPLAIHLGRCVQALRDKNRDAYVASGREAAALLRDAAAKKTPLGTAAIRWLMTTRPQAFDTTDFQAAVIADLIAGWEPGQPTVVFTAIDTALSSDRANGSFWDIPANRRVQALALNAAIGRGILAQLEKGRFEPDLFVRFRSTKKGAGWIDQTAGKEVLAKLIDTKAFLVHRQRFEAASATCCYQQLILYEFQSLANDYPVASFFDDMFVEESKASGWLDPAFLNHSRDEKLKAATLAAEIFSACEGLATGPNTPLDYGRLPRTLVAGDGRQAVAGKPNWDATEVKTWYGRALAAPPPMRQELVAKAEAGWGKTRFDAYAMGYASLPNAPAAIAAPQARADYFQRLATLLERRATYPARIDLPGLAAIAQLPAADYTPQELATVLTLFSPPTPPVWQGWGGVVGVAPAVVRAFEATGRDADLLRIAPELWRVARDTGSVDVANQLTALTANLAKAGRTGVSAALAEAGLQIIGTALPEAGRTQLAAIRTESLLQLGGGNPVPRSDPRWPIYEAQIQFAAGKFQGAWDLYAAADTTAAKMLKELDPAFSAWLIRENTRMGNFDRARELGQLLLAWSDSAPGALSAAAQANLLVAYADIALARREYAQARVLYERIAAAKEFDDTAGKRDAELRVAEVDRLTRQFDAAQERLKRLTRRPDRALQAEAYYQLALLKTDQEEIEEAAGFLEEAFTRVPDHVGGRILEGRLNLLRRKYDVAAKVKLGSIGDRKHLIPGKPLEVDLEDRNLAVIGKATQIEIRAWTEGGDEERFTLFPFGDSKTRFTGQIPTQLGAAVKGNRVLELRGGDTVRYAFAESFAGGGKDRPEQPPAMAVVTDAEILASSGVILSKEEQENQALEKMIRERLAAADRESGPTATLAAVRSEDQIKPGNPVNVRVVDPDRSTTPERDAVEVRATTASGDGLTVKLMETAPFSGVFEGQVPTGSGQATAYASDSTDGNDPNNAIGPAGATPWVALADSKRPKTFAVDLNDNVALGTLTVTANVPGRKLTDVYVQTSLNGRDFRTVGQWRADGKATFVPWNGAPRAEVARIVGQPAPFTTVDQFAAYLERGRLASGSPLVLPKLDGLAVGPWKGDLGGTAAAMGVQEWYVGHWVAAFEVTKPETRTFTLDTKGKANRITYLFAIDGQVATGAGAPLKITRALAKGVHRIDVYAYAHVQAGLHFEVLTDAPEPPFTASIPAEAFSIATHPAIAEAVGTVPAAIKANADGSVLEVAFAKGSRARVLRLLIAGFETDAPAINAVALVDAEGKRVLPTPRSFLETAANDVLEIIPGDRLSVVYEDPTVITPEKATQQRSLTATFTNAEVSAAFVEFLEQGGVRRARYVPMRRFTPGDTVNVFIADADMDVSAEADRVRFSVRSGRGQPVEVEALETAAHSGVFIGTVFPVEGAPQRPTEVTVAAGDDLRLTYLDRENTEPGIPWERIGVVERAGADEPQLRVYDTASRPLDAVERKAMAERQGVGRRFEEQVPVTREIVAVRPEKVAAPGQPASVLVDGPLLVELLAPGLAKSAESAGEIFVQTEAGRERLGRPIAAGEFPLDVPGTIRLRRFPGDAGGFPTPPGVSGVVVRGNRFAVDPLAEGRFTFLVDKQLGALPSVSLVGDDTRTGSIDPPVLQIRGNDTIYVGHRFTTPAGEERWVIQPVTLTADILFDVMDERYREPIEGTHVGDSLHVRLINPALDVSDDKDRASVRLAASGGGELDLVLTETFGHSGVFKGATKLTYRDAAAAPTAGDSAADARTLPVTYGETVTLRYAPPTGDPIERRVAIFKGGDARLVPFTKRFNDPAIAVQTQFTVAEAWFELAKRHRELGQESLARREIAQGKKLLEEAIRDYPDTEARAQADYLLANLAFEFSKEAANEEIARQHALDAVARFGDIVSNHPDSEYAPKSQFKKALVLETLGEIDQACEEYVKLSYRYPDNELVAETIARLGQYFLAKGKRLDEESGQQRDPVEKEKVAIQGREMFTTAGEVFGRLSERFPQHALANKTRMLSGQCFLRARDLKRSLAVFEGIARDPQSDKDLAAEALYWAGDINLQLNDPQDAYRAFKKLTWDYPESKWAKFARGRLTEDVLVNAAASEETR